MKSGNFLIKATGIITFLSGVALLVFMFFVIAAGKVQSSNDPTPLMTWGLMVGVSIAVIYYTSATKFGNVNLDELERIDFENAVLRKRIEQKELMEKLQKGEVKEKV